jgi:hypothetical protein
MIYHTVLLISLSSLATLACAAEWKPLSGTFAITGENYLDPGADEPANSHFRMQLTGDAAKDLYAAIPGASSVDACTGAQSKSAGDVRCLYIEAEDSYEYTFSVNLVERRIEYGVAC